MSFSSSEATEKFNLTAEQNAHVNELNSVEEITAYMKECAVENGVAERLAINGGIVEGALVEPKAQPTDIREIRPTGRINPPAEPELQEQSRW